MFNAQDQIACSCAANTGGHTVKHNRNTGQRTRIINPVNARITIHRV